MDLSAYHKILDRIFHIMLLVFAIFEVYVIGVVTGTALYHQSEQNRVITIYASNMLKERESEMKTTKTSPTPIPTVDPTYTKKW